jgi:uncharacterized protein with NRDE domain
VCLLIALFGVEPDAPLIVAANRDERLDRPAKVMTILRDADPRILGGRDELAGGTWLAVNEHGLVAGLTNQPSGNGRDPSKRSRGELPLAFAQHKSAAEAVRVVTANLDPAHYNPCWMLVGDRHAMFSIGLSGSGRPEVGQLQPGLHVLENAPLRPPSAKAAFVERLVAKAKTNAGPAGTFGALEDVLRDHTPSVPEPRTDATGRVWPPSISAACVHAEGYGTRSAMTVLVPAAGLPIVRVADGRPCVVRLQDVSDLWTASSSAEMAG